MNCQQIQTQLDNILDDDLPSDLRTRVELHLDQCAQCREAVTKARTIQEALRDMPVPPMRRGFAEQALKHAANHHQYLRRGFVAGFSTALAASLALAFVVSGLLPQKMQPPSPVSTTVAEVVITMEQPQTVNLVFDVAHAMDNATLSIVLPNNIEVIGFPGQQEITWKTSLQQGRNILPLPLKGLAQSSSTIMASIEQGGRKKSIRVPVKVDDKKTKPAEALIPAHMV